MAAGVWPRPEGAEDWPQPSRGQEKPETATLPAGEKELPSVATRPAATGTRHRTPVCPAHRGWGLGEQPPESCCI